MPRGEKKHGMSVLQGSGNSAYIGKWRTNIRKDLEENSSIQEEEVDVEVDEVELAIPLGCAVPIGFKVRKIFEDGNYYDGEVDSGPSTAFDNEVQKMVSCWSVKYTDGDEEEFSLEELNMWAVVAITAVTTTTDTTTSTTTSAAENNDDDDDSALEEPTAKRIKSTTAETNNEREEIPNDNGFTTTATATTMEVVLEL